MKGKGKMILELLFILAGLSLMILLFLVCMSAFDDEENNNEK